MSYVTNVILITEIQENPSHVFETINAYLESNHHGRFEILNEMFGGEKVCECDVYGAAFNSIDLDAFIEFITTIKWELPDYVRLVVKRQEQIPEMIDPFNYRPEL